MNAQAKSEKRPSRVVLLFLCALSMVLESNAAEAMAERATPDRNMERRAEMLEIRGESDKLRAVLQSNAAPEVKRQAMEAFREKRERQRARMLSQIPEQTLKEKAEMRQRMRESISRLPKEQREIMEKRLEISEEMEKFRNEEKRLNPSERRQRIEQLMSRRTEVMEMQLAAADEEEARMKVTKQPKSPFHQAREGARAKLETALKFGDHEQRRAAMEEFRTAMTALWESRMQRLQERVEISPFSPSEKLSPP